MNIVGIPPIAITRFGVLLLIGTSGCLATAQDVAPVALAFTGLAPASRYSWSMSAGTKVQLQPPGDVTDVTARTIVSAGKCTESHTKCKWWDVFHFACHTDYTDHLYNKTHDVEAKVLQHVFVNALFTATSTKESTAFVFRTPGSVFLVPTDGEFELTGLDIEPGYFGKEPKALTVVEQREEQATFNSYCTSNGWAPAGFSGTVTMASPNAFPAQSSVVLASKIPAHQ